MASDRKIDSGGLTNKQNGLTHTPGTPDQEKHSVSSKAQVIFACFLSHPHRVAHSSHDHNTAAVASGTVSSHSDIQRQKRMISLSCISFSGLRILSLCLFLKTKNLFPEFPSF